MDGLHDSVKSHLPSCAESSIEIEGATVFKDGSTTIDEKRVAEEINKTNIHERRAVSSRSTVKRKMSKRQRTSSLKLWGSSTDCSYSCGADRSSEHPLKKIKSPSSSVAKSNIPTSSSISAEKSGYRENNANVRRTDTGKNVKATMSKDSTTKKHVLLKRGTRNSAESRGKMSSAKSSVTPSLENIENMPANRPLQSVAHSLHKDRSKSGHPPSTKRMIPKTSTRSVHVLNSCFTDNAGKLDDREELLVAANSACNASYRACSSSFWKKMECYFAPVTLQDESYLKHHLDFAEELRGSLCQIPGEENNYVYNWSSSPSLCQKLLSAIIEDESDEMITEHGGRSGERVSSNTGSNRSVCNSVCTSEHWQADDGLSYYADDGSSLDSSPISSSDCSYNMLPLDDKILLELQSIGLCSDMRIQHAGVETIEIDGEIIELQARLFQQAERVGKSIGKLYEAISFVKDTDKRNIEQAAMIKLTEMAYKKQMVSRQSESSKGVLRKVSKQTGLAFAERTLGRCRMFEDTGISCFSEATLQHIMFSKLVCNTDRDPVNNVDSRSSSSRNKRPLNHNSDLMGSGSLFKQKYAGNSHEPIVNNETNMMLLNNFGRVSSRALSHGSMKQKRTERTKDQTIMLTNKYVLCINHPPMGSSQAVHRSEATPMQKASYSLTLEDGPGRIFMEPTSNELHASSPPMTSVNEVIRTDKENDNMQIEKEPASDKLLHASRPSRPMASVNEVTRTNEQDYMEMEMDFPNRSGEQPTELGSFEHEGYRYVDGLQDYSSFLDFDIDGLQDQELLGLDIPVDDLSDIPMYDFSDVDWFI